MLDEFESGEAHADQALELIVRQAWGRDRCPEALRDRLTRQVRSHTQVQPNGWRFSGRSHGQWYRSAAATIGVAAGLGLSSRSPRPVTLDGSAAQTPAPHLAATFNSTGAATDSPAHIVAALVRLHDRYPPAGRRDGLDVDDRVDVSLALLTRPRLPRSTLLVHPTGGGWAFRGATVRECGAGRIGHLIFIRGDLTLSIFSLPPSVAASRVQRAADAAAVDDHAIAVFTRNGATYCLVASGPAALISRSDLNRLLETANPPARSAEPPRPRRGALAPSCWPTLHHDPWARNRSSSLARGVARQDRSERHGRHHLSGPWRPRRSRGGRSRSSPGTGAARGPGGWR